MAEEVFDLIIIGGGPAGITAGIYASRLGLNALLITKNFGGQMAQKPIAIDNYPGFESIGGMELIKKMESHLRSLKIEIQLEEASGIEKEENFLVKTKSGKAYSSKSLILTSGTEAKQLNIPGEKEFTGRGVSYCAVCDGPLFKNKEVAIIGGGNVGLETAIFLSNIAKKIYILEFSNELKAFEENISAIKKSKNIEIIFNAKAKEINGEKMVKSLVYTDLKTNLEKELEIQGVFVEIGYKPAVSYIQKLADFNERGEIKVNCETMETKTPGLFAAGDVTSSLYKQIVVSAGEGAKAALSAYKYDKSLAG